MKITTLSLATSLLITALNASTENKLEKVTVTAALNSKQSIENLTSNIEIITAQELEEKHIKTLSDALNLLTGVNFSRNGNIGQTTSVYVRGFDSRKVLVLIDGVRVNDPTNINGAFFEHIMVQQIEQIELIKGAQSGVWGSDASGGVINIVTKKAKSGTLVGANIEYGSFNTKKYGAFASFKDDKFDFKLDANKFTTDGITAFAKRFDDIDKYEDDKYENKSINLKAGYSFNDSNRIHFAHTNIDVFGEYDSWDGDSDAFYKQREKFSQVSFENRTNLATSTIFANYSDFKRDYADGFEFDGNILDVGAKTDIKYLKDSFLVVGLDYKEFKHKNEIDKKYSNKAIFITNSNQFFDNTILTESLRFDSYDKFDDKITFKVGIKHNLFEDFFISSNVGSAYNTPTIYQLYDESFGNTALNPEDTKSFDLTIGYKNFKVTRFQSNIKKMIDYDFITSRYNNLDGISKLKGYEFSFSDELLKDTFLTVGYTILNAKNQRKEKLGRRADDTFKFGVDYYGFSKLHVGFFGEYIGERFDFNNKLGAQTGRYTIVNMVLNYDYSKEIKIYGSIDNMFDKYYQTVDNYATLPRTYYAGLRYEF